MRRSFPGSRALLLPLVALGLVFTACGGDPGEAAPEPLDLGPDPASITPADAPAYAEVVVRPVGEQADRLRSALSKLLDSDDPGGAIVAALDASIGEELGVTYGEAIEPWLGPRIGGFVLGIEGDLDTGRGLTADGAVAVSVTDQEAAIEALSKIGEEAPEEDGEVEEKAYEGVDYLLDSEGLAFGFIEDFMVFATEPGFRASVDASRGDALADSAAYLERLEETDEDRLLTFFIDGPGALEALEENGTFSRHQLRSGLGSLGSLEQGTVIGTGTADEDALKVSVIAPPSAGDAGTPAAELLADLPEDAWFAFGFEGIGELAAGAGRGLDGELGAAGVPGIGNGGIGGLLRRELGFDLDRDLLSWMGDAAFYIEGSALLSLGAGLVIESTDPRASRRALGKLERLLGERLGLETEPAPDSDAGFSLVVPGVPFGAAALQRGDRVVIAGGRTSPEDLLDPAAGETLGESERWAELSEALGEGIEPGFLLDFRVLVELIESVPGVGLDPDFESSQRYLRHLDYFVVGNAADPERSVLSIVLGLREGDGDEPRRDDESAAAVVAAP